MAIGRIRSSQRGHTRGRNTSRSPNTNRRPGGILASSDQGITRGRGRSTNTTGRPPRPPIGEGRNLNPGSTIQDAPSPPQITPRDPNVRANQGVAQRGPRGSGSLARDVVLFDPRAISSDGYATWLDAVLGTNLPEGPFIGPGLGGNALKAFREVVTSNPNIDPMQFLEYLGLQSGLEIDPFHPRAFEQFVNQVGAGRFGDISADLASRAIADLISQQGRQYSSSLQLPTQSEQPTQPQSFEDAFVRELLNIFGFGGTIDPGFYVPGPIPPGTIDPGFYVPGPIPPGTIDPGFYVPGPIPPGTPAIPNNNDALVRSFEDPLFA